MSQSRSKTIVSTIDILWFYHANRKNSKTFEKNEKRLKDQNVFRKLCRLIEAWSRWLQADFAEWKSEKALLYTRHIRAYTKTMVLD